MRDFPRDVVSRHILVKTLWRQERRDEAEAEFVALEALAPSNPYVQSLLGMMTTIQVEEVGAPRPEMSGDLGMEAAVCRGNPRPGKHSRGRSE